MPLKYGSSRTNTEELSTRYLCLSKHCLSSISLLVSISLLRWVCRGNEMHGFLRGFFFTEYWPNFFDNLFVPYSDPVPATDSRFLPTEIGIDSDFAYRFCKTYSMISYKVQSSAEFCRLLPVLTTCMRLLNEWIHRTFRTPFCLRYGQFAEFTLLPLFVLIYCDSILSIIERVFDLCTE